jgi:hypothetical protein
MEKNMNRFKLINFITGCASLALCILFGLFGLVFAIAIIKALKPLLVIIVPIFFGLFCLCIIGRAAYLLFNFINDEYSKRGTK